MTMIEEIRTASAFSATSDAKQLSPLTLALIGDTVCDLYVRVCLTDEFARSPRELHFAASRMVCAAGQAAAYRRMEQVLTPEETAIFKRGRNAHSGTMPKNASAADYHTATGLEALIGWLFLTGSDARLNELMQYFLATDAK